MSFLTLFTLMSWSACALPLSILLALIVYRSWANWRAQARSGQRAKYIALLKARAEQQGDGPVRPADDVFTDLSADILELVRGDEKARFATRAADAGAAATLHNRLREGDPRTRALAAAALAHFSDTASQAALTEALDDKHPRVRLVAALSLAAIGHAAAPQDVIDRLGIGIRERSLLVVPLLAESARHDVAQVRALLVGADTAPQIRVAAAEALAMNGDFATVPDIVALAIAADPWTEEVPRYLAALGEIEHPAGAPAVLHWLNAPTAKVRVAAARAAGRIRVTAALDRLERLLGDDEWWVRFEAAQALLKFGKEGEKRLNRIAMRGEDPARETAALTLAEQAVAA